MRWFLPVLLGLALLFEAWAGDAHGHPEVEHGGGRPVAMRNLGGRGQD